MEIITRKQPQKGRPFVLTLIVAGTLILAVFLILWSERPPQAKSEVASDLVFSSERAMRHVENIAQYPHPSGTLAINGVRVYLREQMEQLELNPELQEFNGRLKTKHFDADIELTNILGVIKGSGNGKPLLLMSHYDSVPTGPGANDASVSVASLLETARALQAGPKLQNDIWILLTDGEERGLLGAEVFFRDPKHQETIGMVANFEARGSKGSSFMFQTSEGNGRLIEEYSKAVTNPVSNSLLVDLYKKLPNDTDLTVALENGLPGLNFAYGDGWVAYHTPMDNVDNVSLQTMQHQGENALAIAKHFGNLDLSNLESENRIYFNMFGILIHYPASWSVLISVIFAGIWLFFVIYFVRKSLVTLKGSLLGLLITLGSMLLSIGLSYGLWQLIFAGWAHKVTMFSGATYDAILYNVCFALVALIVNVVLFRLVIRKVNEVDMMLSGMCLFLLLLIGSTWMLPGASYLFTIPLLAHFIALTWAIWSRKPMEIVNHPVVILGTLLIPVLMFTSFFYILFIMMPPSISLFSSAIASLILAFSYPAMKLLAQSWRLVLPAAMLAIVLLLAFGWDQAEPSPERPVYTAR
ncbi:Predicted aminopeptidases [Paenibacillus uliginis N3/975]|uniref:Vacuolar membrane protease n=1 Tax=Paenibacillus uliginis N3/975 TaxID=1313296 RepID=A0A1X7HA94_9BACL|nr:M28 family peptidase [Paenibacillus uliginis]SMF82607.1 Predicted aminopeptidases [Paenibacillus uliginis N3/975]